MDNNLLYQLVSQVNETEDVKRGEEMEQDLKRRREDYTQLTDVPKQDKFKKEDHLSTLTIDCLLDVLARVDHDDLDELATLSKIMLEQSNVSRQKAVKVVATELIVSQITETTFDLFVSCELGPVRSLQITLHDLPEKKFRSDFRPRLYGLSSDADDPKKQVISEDITNRAKKHLDRFDFEGVIFHSISLDDHFLDYFEYIVSSRSFKSFLRILLSTKTACISLMHLRTHIVHEKFLIDYSKAVPFPDLIEVSSDLSTLQVTESFAEPLSKFKTFDINYLLVNTNWLMASMIKRLRQKMEGDWVFNINNLLDQMAIRAALEDDLEYEESERLHCIKIIGTPHKVTIKISATGDPIVWKLTALFEC